MSLKGNVIYVIAMTITSIGALPANYCNFPVNRSDCGAPPVPVFSYWKPGSRCEIEIWRGCPSYNRFDSEITCSHYCIGRLYAHSEEEEEEVEATEVAATGPEKQRLNQIVDERQWVEDMEKLDEKEIEKIDKVLDEAIKAPEETTTEKPEVKSEEPEPEATEKPEEPEVTEKSVEEKSEEMNFEIENNDGVDEVVGAS